MELLESVGPRAKQDMLTFVLSGVMPVSREL
jgi:hypothetical protein